MARQSKMPLTTFLQLLLFSISASAQLLTTGNGQLPACAQACPLLNQAVQACSGVTASNQGTWICFCQSAYLTNLYITPVGICDSVCTDASQNQQVMTWYQTNCGTDKGASEHPAGAAAASGATTATTATTTSPTTATTAASTASGALAAGSFVPVSADASQPGGWWANHAKWVIMLIVIIIGLALITALLIWLKRRHKRRQDAVIGGFNEGITMRTTPMATIPTPAPVHGSSGRDSPARTRDAFMPYGYGYSRSESRLGSRTNVDMTARGSPLAHDGTTMDDFGSSAMGPAGKKKRVYVTERRMSGRESPEINRF